MHLRTLACFLVVTSVMSAQQFPQAEISNGVVKAKLLLPDVKRGYYRGTRFDWAGVIESLTYKGHEFFGQWFSNYDPLLHDAIMGPVEEFRSDAVPALGYNEAKASNGLFMKIGIGVLRKPYDEPYNFARTFALVNPGKRVVTVDANQVRFVHELSDGEGYSYEYTKIVRLPDGKAELVLEHSLKNTGKRTIDTEVYNHDFYMLDHEPTGPDFHVTFRFPVAAKTTLSGPVQISGSGLRYERELTATPRESAYGELTGYSDAVADNDIRVENLKAGIGVRETIDQPISKLYFWSVRTTVCPEAYIKVHVEPGKTFKWRTTYQFYLL